MSVQAVDKIAEWLEADPQQTVPKIREDISNLNSKTDYLRNNTCVNLLQSTLGTTTSNGVTCEALGDGTFRLNGTASGDAAAFLVGTDINCTNGVEYKIVGCPSGGSQTTYLIGWNFHGYDTGNGLISPKDTNIRNVQIVIVRGQTVNNLIFKPMITTDLDATYDDFVPYTGNSGRLNENVSSLETNINNYISEGFVPKNLIKANDITLSGAWFVIYQNTCFLKKGIYTLSFDCNGTSSSSAELALGNAKTQFHKSYFFNVINGKNTYTFTLESDIDLVNFYSNVIGTYSNIMIEKGKIATEYTPYVSSNANLSNAQTDLKMLGWSVPEECPIKNYVDSDRVFHQRVGRVDLGSLNWTNETTNRWSSHGIQNLTPNVANDKIANCYSVKYQVVSANEAFALAKLNIIGVSKDGLLYCASSNKPTGYLYYELSNEILISMDGNEAVTNSYFLQKMSASKGTFLGTEFTAQQKRDIANSDFSRLPLGGYWTIGGHNWRIWDANWFINKGDTACTEPHLVIMPDDNLLKADGSTHYMNDTNTTDGGYAGTKYRSTYRQQCEDIIKSCFGNDAILSHRELLCNAVTNGKPSGWNWYDATVELPGEIMLIGSTVWSNYTDGGSGYNVGTTYPQLALARICPEKVINRENYWERDVASASVFAHVADIGNAVYSVASYPWAGVRPYFLLKGSK